MCKWKQPFTSTSLFSVCVWEVWNTWIDSLVLWVIATAHLVRKKLVKESITRRGNWLQDMTNLYPIYDQIEPLGNQGIRYILWIWNWYFNAFYDSYGFWFLKSKITYFKIMCIVQYLLHHQCFICVSYLTVSVWWLCFQVLFLCCNNGFPCLLQSRKYSQFQLKISFAILCGR